MPEQSVARTRTGLRVKWVGRYDPSARMVRLGRIMWERGTIGDGEGYSAKLSLALRPVLFGWSRTAYPEWMLTVAGLRIHYQRAYGGRHV